MKTWKKTAISLAPFLLSSLALLAGCEPQGPAEKAGESIDRAVDNAKDAVEPKGPMEKAGENVDRALGK